MLPFLSHKSVITRQIKSKKVPNFTTKCIPLKYAKNETTEASAHPQQPHKPRSFSATQCLLGRRDTLCPPVHLVEAHAPVNVSTHKKIANELYPLHGGHINFLAKSQSRPPPPTSVKNRTY